MAPRHDPGPEAAATAGDVGAVLVSHGEPEAGDAKLIDLAAPTGPPSVIAINEHVVVALPESLADVTDEFLVPDFGTSILTSRLTGAIVLPVTVGETEVGALTLRASSAVLQVDLDGDRTVDVIDALVADSHSTYQRHTTALSERGRKFLSAHAAGAAMDAWCSTSSAQPKSRPTTARHLTIEMCGEIVPGMPAWSATQPFDIAFARLVDQASADEEQPFDVGSTSLAGDLLPGAGPILDELLDKADKQLGRFPLKRGLGVIGIMFEVLEFGNELPAIGCEKLGPEACHNPLWDATPDELDHCNPLERMCGVAPPAEDDSSDYRGSRCGKVGGELGAGGAVGLCNSTGTAMAVKYPAGCILAYSTMPDPQSFCSFYDYAWANDWYIFELCNHFDFVGGTQNPHRALQAREGSSCR